MDQHGKISRSDNNKTSYDQEDEMEVRRGPWSGDEDCALINYIAQHGEGRWNSLALCAGLKRTGKSCRLRWLNYLRPDLRRGDMTLEEQLLILELHSRWGNRWSKIAQHVPGRTDNEIKNYWRTRVQKQAKQLNCDVDSKQFKDAMRYLWMPRLVEKIQATNNVITNNINQNMGTSQMLQPQPNNVSGEVKCSPENSTATLSSPDSFETPISDLTECFNNYLVDNQDYYPTNYNGDESLLLSGSINDYSNQGLDFAAENIGWIDDSGDVSANLWNIDDIWFLQQ